jgi:ActR/RegA family two-component response regulator
MSMSEGRPAASVLIVDDDEAGAAIFAYALTGAGYYVYTAHRMNRCLSQPVRGRQ